MLEENWFPQCPTNSKINIVYSGQSAETADVFRAIAVFNSICSTIFVFCTFLSIFYEDIILLDSKEEFTGCMMRILVVPNIVQIRIHGGVIITYD